LLAERTAVKRAALLMTCGGQEGRHGMIITKIYLKNWKNFSEVSVSCGKRVFLIGPNASGKSNFLDALRFLHNVALDGLSKAVAARGGMKAIRFLNARRPSDVTIIENPHLPAIAGHASTIEVGKDIRSSYLPVHLKTICCRRDPGGVNSAHAYEKH
jgi:hypothetical protein